MTAFEIIGIVLLIVGFVLAGIEMAVPGFGLPGISGIISLVLGIIFTADTVSEGIIMAIIVIVILGIMLAVAMALLGSKKMKSPMVLREDVKGEQGFLESSDLDYLVGKEGVAATDLRPAGKCNIEGIEFDVRSDGRYIAKGSKVQIVRIQGNTLIIKNK